MAHPKSGAQLQVGAPDNLTVDSATGDGKAPKVPKGGDRGDCNKDKFKRSKCKQLLQSACCWLEHSDMNMAASKA